MPDQMQIIAVRVIAVPRRMPGGDHLHTVEQAERSPLRTATIRRW